MICDGSRIGTPASGDPAPLEGMPRVDTRTFRPLVEFGPSRLQFDEMPHLGWQAAPATLTDPSTSGCRNSGRYASRKGRLEEGDQFLGDGFGFEQWGKVTDARQLSDVRVDDVLGHVAFHVGEEGAE